MKHLIICREFPPACGGGIGTYAYNISRLMAENGECVHIISQLCENDNQPYTELIKGRLIVHRIAFDDWTAFFEPKPHPELMSKIDMLYNELINHRNQNFIGVFETNPIKQLL